MNAVVSWAISWLIARYTDQALRAQDVDRIKRFIIDLETRAINKAIKHEETKSLVLSIATDLSDNVIDWVIRTLLYLIRVLGLK